MDALTLELVEQRLMALLEDGDEHEESAQAAEELVEKLEALVAESQQMKSGPVQGKLDALLEAHPWMAPEQLEQDLGKVVRENASVKSRRRKVIAIANRVTAALEPYVACTPGCSHCCHMNTMIYEHEAVRLAEVTGRNMVRLAYRPLDEVVAAGNKFNGKPCPFLIENKCSVYEDRPLVCRTHHSLREDGALCSMEIPATGHVRPPMYDPDILETPYIELNAAHNPVEPWGNIAEFFPE